jgi:hypothetical protein
VYVYLCVLEKGLILILDFESISFTTTSTKKNKEDNQHRVTTVCTDILLAIERKEKIKNKNSKTTIQQTSGLNGQSSTIGQHFTSDQLQRWYIRRLEYII